MTLEIALTDDIETCQRLRRIVFIEEQGVSVADEVDGLDEMALHLLARQDGVAIGTARLLVKSDTLKIGRVCVLPDHRGTGLGIALIEASLRIGRDRGLPRAYLSAQTNAVGFYEALGFVAYGPVYDDAGIAHRDMERAL
jgi:ElaA protein